MKGAALVLSVPSYKSDSSCYDVAVASAFPKLDGNWTYYRMHSNTFKVHTFLKKLLTIS